MIYGANGFLYFVLNILEVHMKPIIGITSSIAKDGSVNLAQAYVTAVTAAGGVPVILPNLAEDGDVERLASRLDGLLVSGGVDLDPTLFNEEPIPGLGEVAPERDRFELAVLAKFLAANKPILAICRGIQVLAVATGGDIYQDIYSQVKEQPLLQHQQKAPRWHASHFVDAEPSSLLHEIAGARRFKVNSFHHQSVRRVGDGFRVSAISSDGMIEAIESTRHRFVVGVQWHPECLVEKNDAPSKRLFEAFVRASEKEI
jgi:putative glutamine amidotransferase